MGLRPEQRRLRSQHRLDVGIVQPRTTFLVDSRLGQAVALGDQPRILRPDPFVELLADHLKVGLGLRRVQPQQQVAGVDPHAVVNRNLRDHAAGRMLDGLGTLDCTTRLPGTRSTAPDNGTSAIQLPPASARRRSAAPAGPCAVHLVGAGWCCTTLASARPYPDPRDRRGMRRRRSGRCEPRSRPNARARSTGQSARRQLRRARCGGRMSSIRTSGRPGSLSRTDRRAR